MPLSKYKHPDKYPQRFHRILESGRGEWWMELENATEAEARLEMRRFGYFKTAVGKTHTHRLWRKVQGVEVRGMVMLSRDSYGFDVRITIRPQAPRKPRTLSITPQTNDREICQAMQEFLSPDLPEGD